MNNVVNTISKINIGRDENDRKRKRNYFFYNLVKKMEVGP